MVVRESLVGVKRQHDNCEWTREGSLKSLKVDADGDLNRYLQECMLVHD